MAGGRERQPANAYPIGELTVDWREYIGKSPGYTQDYAFGPNATRASFTIDVKWEDLESAVKQITGYSVAVGDRINRHLPIQHPNFTWLWAKNVVHIAGVRPAGVAEQPTTKLLIQQQYSVARLTIEFWVPPYAVLQDLETPLEQYRYTEWHCEGSGEFITRAQGMFKIDDATAPNNGREIRGTRSQYLVKKRIVCRWHQVPENGILPDIKNGNFDSPNIDAALGKVNDAAFLGQITGTMLMEGPKFDPVPMGISPIALGVASGVPRSWDVDLSWLFFDPPVNSAAHGHNTAPDVDNFWYAIKAIQGANLQYSSTAMDNVFKLNL